MEKLEKFEKGKLLINNCRAFRTFVFMSGHSKWANIKRQKNAQDQARGRVFSKLSKLISTAVKEGGGGDPDKNVQLRQAIERAKEEDMPKDNIERAIENALNKADATRELVLEGYGPFGLAVLIKAFTDNRQRTIQEIKNIFEKHGGGLAEPGSVVYKFNKKAQVIIKKPKEEDFLNLIDLGAEDISETNDQIEVLVKPENLKDFLDQAEKQFDVLRSGIDLIAEDKLVLDQTQKNKIKEFIEIVKNHPDVESVFTND